LLNPSYLPISYHLNVAFLTHYPLSNPKLRFIDLKPNKFFINYLEQKKYETTILINKLSKNSWVICLDETGIHQTSIEFSQVINKHRSKNIDFVIGGAYGLDKSIKDKANMLLSLSNMTLPHKLAKLILIEQIYRSYTILQNHPYNK
jgi:23S rRNA (pseudouridine1915-N3)-methyltransferase